MNSRKNKIIKIALSQILKKGLESVTLKDMAHLTNMEITELKKLFADDDELRIEAVEYAGKTWVSEIINNIHGCIRPEGKIEKLAEGYVLGSRDYPQSLSTYIDLWKIIKDQKNAYLKLRLKALYNFYIDSFIRVVQDEIGYASDQESNIHALAVLMTVLSDVLHIQSILLENEVDFDSIRKIVLDFARYHILGDKT